MISTSPAPTVYLVATDGGPTGVRALEVACTLAGALGGSAELHVVHALGVAAQPTMMSPAAVMVPPTDMRAVGRLVLDSACSHATGRFEGKVVGHLAAGDAWQEIVQTGSNLRADLIIVGTAGRTGIARMALGSVAEKVVRHAGCPVLVVRPKEHHTHVEPGIEPPCEDCLRVQEKSARAKLWCDRHTAHHPQGRLHYEFPPTFAMGSMNFRP